MNDQKNVSTNTNDTTAKEQPTARPWVKPSFDRMSLKEAMATKSGQGVDQNTTYS